MTTVQVCLLKLSYFGWTARVFLTEAQWRCIHSLVWIFCCQTPNTKNRRGWVAEGIGGGGGVGRGGCISQNPNPKSLAPGSSVLTIQPHCSLHSGGKKHHPAPTTAVSTHLPHKVATLWRQWQWCQQCEEQLQKRPWWWGSGQLSLNLSLSSFGNGQNKGVGNLLLAACVGRDNTWCGRC